MTKQAEALKLAEELLADIELSRLGAEQCILKGVRLARLVSDEDAQGWLRYELHGYETSSPRWNELMTMTGRWSDGERTKGYTSSLPALQAMVGAERDKLTALQSTSLSGDSIIPAQNNRFAQLNASAAKISVFAAIISGVMAALHDFVTRTYYELLFSEIQADLFASAQSEIDARVAPMMGDVLSKIDVINERLRTGDTEATSHAMTTCRRLIDTMADALSPATADTAEIDGQQVAMTQNHVLNRLNFYAYKSGAAKGRRDRLRRSLSDIYGRVSKGVHEDVTPMEARFVFLQTYLTLGEFVTL
jgi:hypothetical protein